MKQKKKGWKADVNFNLQPSSDEKIIIVFSQILYWNQTFFSLSSIYHIYIPLILFYIFSQTSIIILFLLPSPLISHSSHFHFSLTPFSFFFTISFLPLIHSIISSDILQQFEFGWSPSIHILLRNLKIIPTTIWKSENKIS